MASLADQFGSFAIAAFIIYFVLRAFGPSREKGLVESARRHAFWCAVIGYFASSSATWFSDAATLPFGEQSGLDTAKSTMAAATPALWVGFIYIASQYTWPRQLKPQRTATLAPRSLASPLPKKLLLTLLAVLAGACLTVFAVRDVARIAPQPAVAGESPDDSFSTPARDGLRAAAEVLPYLYASFAFLMLAAGIATLVILRRKPLPGISEHDNRLLRTIWLNRLYRTVGVLLAVQAGEAVHHKARWFHHESDRYLDGSGAGIGYHDQMSGIGNTLDWSANYAVLGVSAVLLLWRPPADFEGLPRTTDTAFGRLRAQLLSLQYLTAATTLVALYAAWSFLPVPDQNAWPTGERETRMLVVFTSAALLYLALNALYLGYASKAARRAAAFPKHAAPLPAWSYFCAGAVSVACAYFLLVPPLDYLWGFVAPSRPIVLGLIALLAAAHAAFTWYSRRATIAWQVSADEEIWYRRVLELRSLRVVTSAILAMLVVGYEFPMRLDLAALLVFALPAAIFLERPHSATVHATAPSTA